jgi:PITH domain
LLTTSSRHQFNQAVRIKSIVLHTSNSQEGPKLIKLLINRSALGFEDVEDAEEPEAALVHELPEDTVKEGRQVDLKFVRFQSVNILHVSETFLTLTLRRRNNS